MLIVERLIPEDDGDPIPTLLSDINVLVITGGQERTDAEYGRLLEAAGPHARQGRAGDLPIRRDRGPRGLSVCTDPRGPGALSKTHRRCRVDRRLLLSSHDAHLGRNGDSLRFARISGTIDGPRRADPTSTGVGAVCDRAMADRCYADGLVVVCQLIDDAIRAHAQ